jgi:hypothetical protein
MSEQLSELENLSIGDISVPSYLIIDPNSGIIISALKISEGLAIDWVDANGVAQEYIEGLYDGTYHKLAVGVNGTAQRTLLNNNGGSNFMEVLDFVNSPDPDGSFVYHYRGCIPVANFPPASPQFGDVVDVIFPAAGSVSSTMWRFLYDTSYSSTYPWIFIGGPPKTISLQAYGSGLVVSSWTPFNDCAWGVTRPGAYIVRGGWSAEQQGGVPYEVAAAILYNSGGGYAAPSIQAISNPPTPPSWFSINVEDTIINAVSGSTFALGYYATAAPTNVNMHCMSWFPIAIA